MRVSLNKKKLPLGLLLVAIFTVASYFAGGSTKAWIILCVGLLIAPLIQIKLNTALEQNIVYVMMFILVPFGTFVAGQVVQNAGIFTVSIKAILGNACVFIGIQLLFLIINRRFRISIVVGILLPFFVCLLNAYVFMFRGNPITPSDILSLRTAANVASEYDFAPTVTMVYAYALMMILVLTVFWVPELIMSRKGTEISICALFLSISIFMVLVGSTGMKSYHWANEGADKNGFTLNFLLQFSELHVSEPEGYNEENLCILESEYEAVSTAGDYPDIIVIMDESFADFTIWDEPVAVSQPLTPFIDSLQENTIKGYLYASVFGGSTANSEYEFLSGSTMGFLPQGAIVYQQFYHSDSYTVLSTMKQSGYHCVAMHPYYANGWMRNRVYPEMGFDEMYFLEDFPQKQLIREYVSDREMFEEIIRYHEQRDTDEPLFLFGITMQNHGGYLYEGPNYETSVFLEGYSQAYPDAEQYLSLIHETDRAVEYLIQYYESVEKNVVIVFFGDHLPNLNGAIYEELNGNPLDTLDEQMLRYKVPFFIWTNYDIEEREVPCTSINYLSNYMLDAAGIPLPPYHQFLADMEREIPAINAYGYYSLNNHGFQSFDAAEGEEKEALRNYAMVQYHHLIDGCRFGGLFFGQ